MEGLVAVTVGASAHLQVATFCHLQISIAFVPLSACVQLEEVIAGDVSPTGPAAAWYCQVHDDIGND